jgi:hypothetical protein
MKKQRHFFTPVKMSGEIDVNGQYEDKKMNEKIELLHTIAH